MLTAEVETARWFDALLERGRRAQAGRQLGRSPSCSARSTASARPSTTARSRPSEAAELLELVADGTISGTLAKQVFEIMLETGEAPRDRRGARASSRPATPARSTPRSTKILAANADKVAEYQGRQGSAVRLLRRPDDEGDGRARPTRSVVNERLRAKLD